MARLRDLILIAAILGAVGFGVFELGRNVDTTSANLSKNDPELGQRVYHPTNPSGPSHHTLVLAAFGLGGTAAVFLLISVGSALAKPRRRKATWRAN